LPSSPLAEAAASGVPAALRLVLPNDPSALEPARQAMHRHLSGVALTARALYRLELVLEEALMNRIWHAYPEGGLHQIEFEILALPTAVQLRFSDDGVAFNPMDRAENELPTSLDQASIGGLGLLLTRKAVCDAHYERSQGRNILTLRVALN
jgi:anti-sigma regulatory factor (Ser/Thr protein kinase)